MFKFLFGLLSIIVVIIIVYYSSSDSYKLSLEAKVKYLMGDYTDAKTLAKKAYELDPYNKMAFSIITQSKISAKLVDYLQESHKYLEIIKTLSKKSDFSNRDKIKIKMICEVMIAKYNKLGANIMTDQSLQQAVKKRYLEFKKIHEELFSEEN